MIAQAATPENIDATVQLLRGLGFPSGLLVMLIYMARKMWKWALPHIESMIAAYLSRQKTMEECQQKLTESTIEIQTKVQEGVQAIQKQLPMLCQASASQCKFTKQ